jgi:hypothetical protein
VNVKRFLEMRFCKVYLAMLTLFVAATPANSRIWSRNPASLAQDYAIITDDRGGGDAVLVAWLSAPMMSEGSGSSSEREVLDKYVVIGLIHGHTGPGAAITFDPAVAPEVSDASGQALKLIGSDNMPSALVATLTRMQTGFAQNFGALGQGTHWFVFEGSTVHACGKGGMAVQFAGERYTYDTPIPGCP